VGFSAIVSTGSMLDVGWGDLIDYFGDDPHTHSILVYMESVGDADSFRSAAQEVSLSKPIIVIKAGRSEAASRAAASHTCALTGSDEVLDAAFRRCGVFSNRARRWRRSISAISSPTCVSPGVRTRITLATWTRRAASAAMTAVTPVPMARPLPMTVPRAIKSSYREKTIPRS
jgi:hypothetical protein